MDGLIKVILNLQFLTHFHPTLGGLWIAGKRARNTDCSIPAGVLVQGTGLEMTLDCTSKHDQLKLELNGTDHSQVITLPSGQLWRLHINLVGHKDAIRLIKAERQTLPSK